MKTRTAETEGLKTIEELAVSEGMTRQGMRGLIKNLELWDTLILSGRTYFVPKETEDFIVQYRRKYSSSYLSERTAKVVETLDSVLSIDAIIAALRTYRGIAADYVDVLEENQRLKNSNKTLMVDMDEFIELQAENKSLKESIAKLTKPETAEEEAIQMYNECANELRETSDKLSKASAELYLEKLQNKSLQKELEVLQEKNRQLTAELNSLKTVIPSDGKSE